jgi:hypothetical protein
VGVGRWSGKGCLEAGMTVRLVEWRVADLSWWRKAYLILKKSIFETLQIQPATRWRRRPAGVLRPPTGKEDCCFCFMRIGDRLSKMIERSSKTIDRSRQKSRET